MLEKRMLDMFKRDEEEKISKSSKAMKLAKKFMGKMEKTSDSEDGQKRTIRMIDKFYKLNTSYWESEASEDDDTDSEDDDFEVDMLEKRMLDMFKRDEEEKISKSSKAMKLAKKFMGNMEKTSDSEDGQKRTIRMIDTFYKLNTSDWEGEASEDDDTDSEDDDFEGISSCPELVGLAKMENDNAIVLRGGTEAPLCASVDKDGKLTKSPRIAFE